MMSTSFDNQNFAILKYFLAKNNTEALHTPEQTIPYSEILVKCVYPIHSDKTWLFKRRDGSNAPFTHAELAETISRLVKWLYNNPAYKTDKKFEDLTLEYMVFDNNYENVNGVDYPVYTVDFAWWANEYTTRKSNKKKRRHRR